MATEPVVALRDVADADLAVFFANQADDEAARMAAVPSRGRAAFDAHWRAILADPAVTVRTIVADGEVAGNVLRFARDGVVEVGYWLGREFWGRGIASRALAQFVALLDERPLRAAVAEHNPASMRVLEKCGFVRREIEGGMVVFELVA
jgi:RimJ/RimL family protein N-acetyltransferase